MGVFDLDHSLAETHQVGADADGPAANHGDGDHLLIGR